MPPHPQVIVSRSLLRCALSFTAARPALLAADVLYSHEGVEPLLSSLIELTGGQSKPSCTTEVFLAAGRNRHAADGFFRQALTHFEVQCLQGDEPGDELHELFRCDDVDVWRLRRRDADNPGGGSTSRRPKRYR